MKKTVFWTVSGVVLAVTAGMSGVCAAQEVGRVISSTPVISQVGVPRQVCSTSQVQVAGQRSGGGALLGAIAGGAIGNNIGGGDGKAVATVLGLLGGALLGDRIEGGGQPQTQNVQNCATQTFYENRTTAYNVVYEYAGKQYSVQMPNDPGPYVKLQVTPVGSASPPAAPAAAAPVYQQPEYVPIQPAPQVISQPIYVNPPVYVTAPPVVYAVPPVVYAAPYGYYGRPYYPPVGVNLNLGWSNGHGHRYWR